MSVYYLNIDLSLLGWLHQVSYTYNNNVAQIQRLMNGCYVLSNKTVFPFSKANIFTKFIKFQYALVGAFGCI